MLSIEQLHEKILYPITRVRSEDVGGSGVLVYSKEDSKRTGTFINLVLTCEHVLDNAIKTQKEWDPVLREDRKRDYFQEVTIEVFDYDGSWVVSANSCQAEIIAYDKHHDLAMLQLHNPRQMPYVAELTPKSELEGIGRADSYLRLFAPTWVSGCSLLHDPFSSSGTLTYLREVIDQKTYVMTNAPSIFGNSGGGLFDGVHGRLIGLTSRITAIQLGFGVDVMTWMGFSTDPKRIYEFLDYQDLRFVYDPTDDYYQAQERREKRRREALKSILFGQEKEG